jgi:hypothetical protein
MAVRAPGWSRWDKLRHAIGMERSNYRRSLAWWLDDDNHRNYYATAPDCDGHDEIEGLVAAGLMCIGRGIPGGLTYYHATTAGIVAARDEFFRVKGDWDKAGGPTP